MKTSSDNIVDLKSVTLRDINLVGGKAGSLGEMLQTLVDQDMRIPEGFVITSLAYRLILKDNGIAEKVHNLCLQAEREPDSIAPIAQHIRTTILSAKIPESLATEIRLYYQKLCALYQQKNIAVVVRSSATAEDLPHASFAGQQESYLNIVGEQQLLDSYLKTVASLFTDRAMVYRMQHNIPSSSVAIAVCVQKMVRSDRACAGIMFTLDPESGFNKVVTIHAAYGLGELIVQGAVTPDEFVVYKDILVGTSRPILKQHIGSKTQSLGVTPSGQLQKNNVPLDDQKKLSLTTQEIFELTTLGLRIENYYTKQRGSWCPMDIEWAKDGDDGLLYIVQARPETIHTAENKNHHELLRYRMTTPREERKILASGQSIGSKIVHGTARRITSYQDASAFQEGDILVTRMTDPDWVPLLRKAAAVITDLGGRTCHAAIVSRELGIPAIIGTENATHVIDDGSTVTIDCSEGNKGYIYAGTPHYTHDRLQLSTIPNLPCNLLVNIGQPESAYSVAQLPVNGVGLARLEFIIAQNIGVHPLALINPQKITDTAVIKAITDRTAGYASFTDFFTKKLAEGIGTIAAAFYPRPVIVRLTDLKSNEYRNLLGGAWFEPEEENPMLGWRGASRYVTPTYEPAFALECTALRIVRTTWGFTNVHLMVPFVRTLQEATKVAALLDAHALPRDTNGLLWYMMVELPVNVILLEQFATIFNGFSIGSNDLTQLTLGIDRDSTQLQASFDEQNPAVKQLISESIAKSHRSGKPIGICGEAPSHYPEFAQFLMEEGINSISLSPDAVIPFLLKYSN